MGHGLADKQWKPPDITRFCGNVRELPAWVLPYFSRFRRWINRRGPHNTTVSIPGKRLLLSRPYRKDRSALGGKRGCLYTGSCTRRTPMRFSGIAKASKVAILVLFPAAVNPLHFVPHIRAPKLLLNGLFLLMREPRNRVSFIGTAIFRRPKSPFR
jgi:hypothetical protein